MKIVSRKKYHVAFAPAKLNLYLEILGKRADGFHELETVMTAIRLYDTLQLSTTAVGQLKFHCSWDLGIGVKARKPLPRDDANLALRALKLLSEHVGQPFGGELRVTKRIPAEAGMGGASSDAAAALLLGNRAWKLGLSAQALHSLGAKLGSDVPFFLQSSAAICRGRGEQITPIHESLPTQYLIVKPDVGLSTAKVYQSCEVPSLPSSYESAVESRFNRLEQTAVRLVPDLSRLRRDFERVGLDGQMMTGSGTAYFGWCDSRRRVIRAARLLRQWGWSQIFLAASEAA